MASSQLDMDSNVFEGVERRTPMGTVTPSQLNSEAASLDFSQLTPSKFGITTDSFSRASNHKDKSRVSQLKSRRRSTIGVRGSPETNSLICYIAKQRMKTPTRTTLASPLLPRCDSLKQKMAAFQRLIEEDDEEEKLEPTLTPGSNNKRLDCSLARASLSDDWGTAEEKENRVTGSHPTPVTTPPSNRPHWGEIRDAPLPVLTCTLQQELKACSFEFLSPNQPEDSGPTGKTQAPSFGMPSPLEMNGTDEPGASSVCKKKRVRFGAPLSPEFFDRELPPSTPLQRGATPGLPTSTGPTLRSLLKTPQRCDPPLPKLDFNSPDASGASPPLAAGRRTLGTGGADEGFTDTGGKINFPIFEDEYDNPLEDRTDVGPAVCTEELVHSEPPSPDVINSAFQGDLPQEAQTVDPEPATVAPAPEPQAVSAAPPARSRKRKQPGENEPEKKRPTRTAAVSASGKMKTSRGRKRFGSKEVDRSLYGKRDFASKHPLLSPICETLLSTTPPQPSAGDLPADEASGLPPTPSLAPAETACSDSTGSLLTAASMWRKRFRLSSSQNTADATQANGTEQSGDGCRADVPEGSPGDSTSNVATGGHRGQPGPKTPRGAGESARPASRRGRGRGRSVTLPRVDCDGVIEGKIDGDVREKVNGQSEDQIEAETESSVCDRPNRAGFDHNGDSRLGADARSPSEREDTRSAVRQAHHDACTETDINHSSPSLATERDRGDAPVHQSGRGEESANAVEQNPNVGRRRHAAGSWRGRSTALLLPSMVHKETEEEEVPGEQGEAVEESVPSAGGVCSEEGGQGRAEEQREDSGREIRAGAVERAAHADSALAPWQRLDFCIDDVLQPVARGRRSVRRSLRNRPSLEPSATAAATGLAWVAQPSPEAHTGRRRTCSRLSAALVSDSCLSEEPPL